MVSGPRSRDLERLLATPRVHEQWESAYRIDENECFYETAFDRIVDMLDAPPEARILDAGCGQGAHSVRLARRGFRVTAMDFSESVLSEARQNVAHLDLQSQIDIRRENLLSLSFPDDSFHYILVWGVLMHVPEVGRAIAEISRVLAPGGKLVVSEGNMRSIDSRLFRAYLRLRGKADRIELTHAGVEHWNFEDDGALVTRHADIPWLIAEFQRHGCHVEKRVAGQLTESYTVVGASAAKWLCHRLNSFWFRWIRMPHPAFANLLFFSKTG